MAVAYPRKFQNAIGAREILTQVVRDREVHLVTLNRYGYSKQRSCVANLLEVANTMPIWQRPQYLMERLPQTLLAPDLQMTNQLSIINYQFKDTSP
jgi:hypothetical protein